ncbi:hypothetical protein CsSME_00002129 [Camellia sinensis var. sinensis]
MKPLVGMVVSNKMQKSVVVAVDRLFHHKLYNRYVKRTSKFMAHDEHNLCNIGDRMNAHTYGALLLSLRHQLKLGMMWCPLLDTPVQVAEHRSR